MDIAVFTKMFVDGKRPMTLNNAADFVHYVRIKECLPRPKWAHLCRPSFVRRNAQVIACQVVENELRNAPPWEDYREIFARLEWPYVCRVISHMDDGRYDDFYGEKWKKSDYWFVEMWTAFHDVFRRMPGFIPDNSSWQAFEHRLRQARNETSKYRRIF